VPSDKLVHFPPLVAGDKVVCVRPENGLKEGEAYTVASVIPSEAVEDDHLTLQGVEGKFSETLFDALRRYPDILIFTCPDKPLDSIVRQLDMDVTAEGRYLYVYVVPRSRSTDAAIMLRNASRNLEICLGQEPTDKAVVIARTAAFRYNTVPCFIVQYAAKRDDKREALPEHGKLDQQLAVIVKQQGVGFAVVLRNLWTYREYQLEAPVPHFDIAESVANHHRSFYLPPQGP
jgi:hypothetical protein